MAQPGRKMSQTPVTSATGLGHTGEQKSGLWGPSACSQGPSSLSAFPPPSPAWGDNQTLPSLPGGWVVGEIMILSCLLPLGSRCWRKTKSASAFLPAPFTFLAEINLASPGVERQCPDAGVLSSKSLSEHFSAARGQECRLRERSPSLCPATVAPGSMGTVVLTSQTSGKGSEFSSDGMQSTACRRAFRSSTRTVCVPSGHRELRGGTVRVQSRT